MIIHCLYRHSCGWDVLLYLSMPYHLHCTTILRFLGLSVQSTSIKHSDCVSTSDPSIFNEEAYWANACPNFDQTSQFPSVLPDNNLGYISRKRPCTGVQRLNTTTNLPDLHARPIFPFIFRYSSLGSSVVAPWQTTNLVAA
jgi:hypothetical protein